MPEWVGQAAALASTFFAAIAAGAGIAAVVVARKTLGEAHSTTELQAKTIEATNTVAELQAKTIEATNAVAALQATTIEATNEVATKVLAIGQLLDRILAEAQVTRELDQLQRIANQVQEVIVWRKRTTNRDATYRETMLGPAHIQLTDARDLLAAYLAALPVNQLPHCRVLADIGAGRDADPQLEVDAQQDLKRAFGAAIARLPNNGMGPRLEK